MGIVECCVFDSITCIIGCIVVYFINDIKAYDKIQLISNDEDKLDNSEDQDKLNNTDNILTFENIKLLHPINEQPQTFIILQK